MAHESTQPINLFAAFLVLHRNAISILHNVILIFHYLFCLWENIVTFVSDSVMQNEKSIKWFFHQEALFPGSAATFQVLGPVFLMTNTLPLQALFSDKVQNRSCTLFTMFPCRKMVTL